MASRAVTPSDFSRCHDALSRAGLAPSDRGELLPLRDWLRENVHRPGYRMSAEELVRKVTGQGLTDADFLRCLKGKYGALYGVSL